MQMCSGEATSPRCSLANSRAAYCFIRWRICWQALIAAAPLRSVPALAAVGEVLLLFSVEVVISRTQSGGSSELVGDQLFDFGIQALTHFGAAGRNLHGAVGVER